MTITNVLAMGALVAIGVASGSLNGDDPRPARAGKVLFEDAFERKDLGKAWSVHPDSFRIEEGAMVAAQRADADHGAVCQTFVDFKDIVLDFRFRLEGESPGFNVVIDDRDYKGSHAGHICRVTVRNKKVELRDDKTGAMKNEYFGKLRDKKRRAEVLPLLAGKSHVVDVDVKRKKWHSLRVKIVGSQMTVSLDGRPLGALTSDGIAHASKSDFGFTVLGRSVRFDDVRAAAPK
jgi:hypothetical protein